MSKPEDPSQVAEVPKPVMEQLKMPEPMKNPPDPFQPGQGLGPSLVSNEEKLSASTSLKTAMLDTKKDLSEAIKKEGGSPTNATVKPEQSTTMVVEQRQSWAEKVAGTKQAYNDDNSESKGKSLYEIKPASATITTQNTEPPKVEKKPSFVERYQQEKNPPPTSTPPKGKGPSK